MPMTDQGLRHIMPGDGGDLEQCDYAEDDPDAGESEGDETVGGSGTGKSRHNIFNHGGYGNYKSSRHTRYSH